MKTVTVLACIFIAFSMESFAQGEEPRLTVKWQGAPLKSALDLYAELSNKSVEVVQGVEITITMSTEEPMSASDMLALIEKELRSSNIGLYPIASNRVVAAWINPPQEISGPDAKPEAAKAAYKERRQQRRDQLTESRRRQIEKAIDPNAARDESHYLDGF